MPCYYGMNTFTPLLKNSGYPKRPRMTDLTFKMDEGFSEDTRSQDEADTAMVFDSTETDAFSFSPHTALQYILGLGDGERSGKLRRLKVSCTAANIPAEAALALLQSLRTSSVASIVHHMRFRLHLDPVSYLPPEIMSEVFSLLNPAELLRASQTSKTWRERCLDGGVWKQKYHSQGWALEMDEIRQFESSYTRKREHQSRRSSAHADERRQKRQARQNMSPRNGVHSVFPRRTQSTSSKSKSEEWNDRPGIVEADEETNAEAYGKDPMQGVEIESLNESVSHRRSTSDSIQSSSSSTKSPRTRERRTLWPFVDPDRHHPRKSHELPLITYTDTGRPRVNYHHIYKQRRALEDNWNQCHYRPFQMPHRDHPEEAHTECVYTLQFIGRHLVSGSRDKTLRIWDLESQRLIRKPLIGHNGSVLCLQFDDSDAEDIIISGSSDTDVILWRYSTGHMLQRIRKAHKESVLNLKFDSRFLVTSSKDKTIKIWNRVDLAPGDKDYPRRGVDGGGKCPSYIIDLADYRTRFDLETKLSAEQRKPLPPYSTLMIIDSHTAAVNAIHIHKDRLVSASGDKTVKIFDINTGKSIATCRGHNKGIACVQFDGSRIVSGSSDNSIRIFDPITQAQVACLEGRDGRKTGHNRLVRTIQAAFEDLPGSKQQLEDEAAEIDRQFTLIKRSGRLPIFDRGSIVARPMPPRRSPHGAVLSQITATGAKLPPGGGGSRWGRIVSGSYDETVIIWRKSPDGTWFPSHRLRQEEALRASGPPLPTKQTDDLPRDFGFGANATGDAVSNHATVGTGTSTGLQPGQHQTSDTPHPQTTSSTAQNHQVHNMTSQHTANILQPNPFIQSMLLAQSTSRTPSPSVAANATSHEFPPSLAITQNNQAQAVSAVTTPSIIAPSNHNNPIATFPNTLHHTTTSTTSLMPTIAASSSSSSLLQPNSPTIPAQILSQPASPSHHHSTTSNLITSPNPPTPLNSTTNQPPNPSSSQQLPPPQPNNQNQQQPQSQPQNQQPQHPIPQQQQQQHPQQTQAPPQNNHQQQQQQQHNPLPQPPNARVFKLQFDARRIVCCSQDPKIVGWDFANGDEAIIRCSRFFGVPS